MASRVSWAREWQAREKSLLTTSFRATRLQRVGICWFWRGGDGSDSPPQAQEAFLGRLPAGETGHRVRGTCPGWVVWVLPMSKGVVSKKPGGWLGPNQEEISTSGRRGWTEVSMRGQLPEGFWAVGEFQKDALGGVWLNAACLGGGGEAEPQTSPTRRDPRGLNSGVLTGNGEKAFWLQGRHLKMPPRVCIQATQWF